MNINFPPVDAGYIKTKVESGYYSNTTEMVRDAVRRMREQDDHHGRLLAALEIGERDMGASRHCPRNRRGRGGGTGFQPVGRARQREHGTGGRQAIGGSVKMRPRDIAAGRTVPYTPELLQQIEQEARTHAANNRPPNPGVIP